MQLKCARTLISMFLADKSLSSLVKLGPWQTLINTLWLSSEPAWLKNNCMQVMPTVFQLSDGFLGGGAGKDMFDLPTLFIFNS